MDTIYGYCPTCGSPSVYRERRMNGNDKCSVGHVFPSSKVLTKPVYEEIARLRARIAELEERERTCHCEINIAVEEAKKRIAELKEEYACWYEKYKEQKEKCEVLRMQLSACGVVALANTETSALEARSCADEYKSASFYDVCSAVDREMSLRARVAELEAALAWHPASEPPEAEIKAILIHHERRDGSRAVRQGYFDVYNLRYVCDIRHGAESVRAIEWCEIPTRAKEQIKMTCRQALSNRYRVEERSGIILIYDTEHEEYKDVPGAHADYPWAVASWHGYCVKSTSGDYWEIHDWQRSKANHLCNLLNSAVPRQITDQSFNESKAMKARVAELEKEKETLRMQLASCGVAALANTVASALEARSFAEEYKSASFHDVCAAVDREMSLRKKVDELEAALEKQNEDLRNALRPFAHPDLCEAFTGNAEGDASIIFQRNKAKITLGTCRLAASLLAKAHISGLEVP